MIVDNILINGIKKELKEKISDSKIDRIFQIDQYTFLFKLRKKGLDEDLLISLHPHNYRIQLTSFDYPDNKQTTPFLLQLRKTLEAGVIKDIEQINFDRIIRIKTECYNMLKDKVNYYLTAELTGKYSNLLFLDEEDIILGAYRYVDEERNEERQLLLDKKYAPITNKFEKLELAEINRQTLNKLLAENQKINLKKLLVSKILGLSSHTAEILIKMAGLINTNIEELSGKETEAFINTVSEFALQAVSDNLYLNFTGEEKPDFSITYQPADSGISAILDKYFQAIENISGYKALQHKLKKTAGKHIAKIEERIRQQEENIKSAGEAEMYKQLGEILLANIYRLPEKTKEAVLENFYDDNKPVKIELDEDFTISENAQKYFKKYNKLKNTEQAALKLIESFSGELSYLEEVDFTIDNSESLEDLREIESELQEQGYSEKKAVKKNSKQKPVKKLLKFVSTDGTEILVGKNNTQNDYLTMRLSQETDIWLHTRLIPGSHVVIRTNNGQKDISDETIIEAAKLAVRYSKAKHSSNVCVIYTRIKNIKKPPGSKPGFVIYSKEKAVYVTPEN